MRVRSSGFDKYINFQCSLSLARRLRAAQVAMICPVEEGEFAAVGCLSHHVSRSITQAPRCRLSVFALRYRTTSAMLPKDHFCATCP